MKKLIKPNMLVEIRKLMLITVGSLGISLTASAQDFDKVVDNKEVVITAEQAQILSNNEKETKKWIDELQTPGVIVDGNQMKFSKEALRLINDPEYRIGVYKEVYDFNDIKETLMNAEYLKAFWQLISIYPKDKISAMKYIYAFDKALPADKMVVSAFYTYAFFDPKITSIENGKPKVYRPDIFEEYLRRTKEIVSYIAYFREEAVKEKEKKASIKE